MTKITKEDVLAKRAECVASIITNGCWTFAPDVDDLARIGLVPQQMITP